MNTLAMENETKGKTKTDQTKRVFVVNIETALLACLVHPNSREMRAKEQVHSQLV